MYGPGGDGSPKCHGGGRSASPVRAGMVGSGATGTGRNGSGDAEGGGGGAAGDALDSGRVRGPAALSPFETSGQAGAHPRAFTGILSVVPRRVGFDEFRVVERNRVRSSMRSCARPGYALGSAARTERSGGSSQSWLRRGPAPACTRRDLRLSAEDAVRLSASQRKECLRRVSFPPPRRPVGTFFFLRSAAAGTAQNVGLTARLSEPPGPAERPFRAVSRLSLGHFL